MVLSLYASNNIDEANYLLVRKAIEESTPQGDKIFNAITLLTKLGTENEQMKVECSRKDVMVEDMK